ncbi:AIM24 family protein [Haloarculaceae archaeon H-GB2-1]|nr:AIM24 family protein [Haloarculaceae archaeon H-GB1-1]MEA5386343.1 AIM24 family protein [Haloarculaceae archaeon H-GB11]MEA5407844.1 AIM24 family protein [Haloarculaceae archaeon H-GB2-1]
MDLDEFTDANAPDEGGDAFQLENSKLLDVELDGSAMAKAGSMVAYDGDISFTGKSSAEGGVTGFLKEKVTSEGMPVMEAEGTGHLYLADQGKEIQVLSLDAGEEISVNGNDILAFEDRVNYEIRTVGSISGSSAAGLTNVFLEGPGDVAITTHGDPLVLTPPVRTDPSATVAWSGELSPSSHVDQSISNMVGQSADETYQLEFAGRDGFVIVQPYEEVQPGQ